ncbi:tetratricopeptide repeat protein [Flavobacterium selenitireducens]|uniref:tetratricopeptide repeat protein n=1 Tax=Flavobacterium selenitireducens TaxID=2722704 RepID=UPI00168B12D8|nr:hypothetical protein [Flavobacterium selenitireducens]MBD3583601.1 hypothetical protein [Flavobacterium selenitireducens]
MDKKTKQNIYHSSLGRVMSSRKRPSSLNTLKNLLDFDNLSDVTDSLSKFISPTNFSIYGNAFPKTLDVLGKGEMLFKPISLENEFKWTFLSIRKFSKQISLFLIFKIEFEKFFLLGDYESAEKTLENILGEFGYSIWYIEAKFLLLEYQDKSEEQKEFLSKINEVNKNFFVSTLAHFLSFRTERNLSAYKYDYDIKSLFSRNKKEDEREIRQYYLFRLNYFENYQISDFSMLLVFENCNSLIDRYLFARDILKILSLKKENFNFAFLKSKYLFKKTSDRNLIPILCTNEIPKLSDRQNYFDNKYLQIIDLYYTGLYDEAIEEIRLFIKIDPSNFDLLILYVRCHINLKMAITPITDIPSLLNQITTKIFQLMNKGENRSEVIYNLYQINKNTLSFDIGPSLNYFLKKEQGLDADISLKLLSLNKFDPYFSKYFKDKQAGQNYLNSGLQIYNNSISISYWQDYLTENITTNKNLSPEFSFINKAKIYFKQGNYEKSTMLWEDVIKQTEDNIPILQTALKYLFESLVNLENYNSAIKLYVNNFKENENSIVKIDSKKLIDILRRKRYTDVRRTIDLPIFISLCSQDDLEKSFIIEQFCKIYDKTLPSNLFEHEIDSDRKKIEYFYFDVCSSEVLKHSIYLNNTIDRLNERLKIINYLKEIFSENEKKYQEELNLISNELIVYEGTLKLEESKIYANDQAIITRELKDIDGLYNRYKTIYNLSLQDKKILLISENSFALVKFNGMEDYDTSEVKYSESALVDVFSELFDSILDKYLFSNFGIVAYLSTRIRHGVLLGELRPELEKQNLILNRIGETDKYEENSSWNSQYFNLNDKKKSDLHSVLTNFSFKIDTLIEDIIKTKIQIKKDGKNENGLFNYEFDKLELSAYIAELSIDVDSRQFCQNVIDLIWQRTDANLAVIREYIDNDIKNKFAEELNALDLRLRSILSNEDLPKIFTNLADSSTVIENKIKKISSWFRRSGSTIDDFNIQKIFDIVWNNTQKCYPKMNVGCKVNYDSNPTIKSCYYIHFTDLFRILLDNMFKYGYSIDDIKNFEFSSYEEDKYLKFKFINAIEFPITDLPFKTKNGQAVVDTAKLISEGKSGISKAIKIVKYDLDNESNMIQVKSPDHENVFEVIVSVEVQNLLQDE